MGYKFLPEDFEFAFCSLSSFPTCPFINNIHGNMQPLEIYKEENETKFYHSEMTAVKVFGIFSHISVYVCIYIAHCIYNFCFFI